MPTILKKNQNLQADNELIQKMFKTQFWENCRFNFLIKSILDYVLYRALRRSFNMLQIDAEFLVVYTFATAILISIIDNLHTCHRNRVRLNLRNLHDDQLKRTRLGR